MLENLDKDGHVEIVGVDLDIPKTVSLVEIVKRKLEAQGIVYQQKNVLGYSE